MLVSLDFGAQVDIASGTELDAGVRKIEEQIKRNGPRPTYLSWTGAILGAGVIILGSPPVGRMWNILSLAYVGNDDSTTVANARAALYVDSQEHSLSLNKVVVPGQTVPYFTTFSKGTLWAHADGSVLVNVTGAVAATDQVVANITVAEWREGEVVDHAAGRF